MILIVMYLQAFNHYKQFYHFSDSRIQDSERFRKLGNIRRRSQTTQDDEAELLDVLREAKVRITSIR